MISKPAEKPGKRFHGRLHGFGIPRTVANSASNDNSPTKLGVSCGSSSWLAFAADSGQKQFEADGILHFERDRDPLGHGIGPARVYVVPVGKTGRLRASFTRGGEANVYEIVDDGHVVHARYGSALAYAWRGRAALEDAVAHVSFASHIGRALRVGSSLLGRLAAAAVRDEASAIKKELGSGTP